MGEKRVEYVLQKYPTPYALYNGLQKRGLQDLIGPNSPLPRKVRNVFRLKNTNCLNDKISASYTQDVLCVNLGLVES